MNFTPSIDWNYDTPERQSMEDLLNKEVQSIKNDLDDLSTFIQVDIRDANYTYINNTGVKDRLKWVIDPNLLTEMQNSWVMEWEWFKENIALLQWTLVSVCKSCGVPNLLSSYSLNVRSSKWIEWHFWQNTIAAFTKVVQYLKTTWVIDQSYKFQWVLDDTLLAAFESVKDTPPEGWDTPPEGWDTPPEGWDTPPEGWDTPPEGWDTPLENLDNTETLQLLAADRAVIMDAFATAEEIVLSRIPELTEAWDIDELSILYPQVIFMYEETLERAKTFNQALSWDLSLDLDPISLGFYETRLDQLRWDRDTIVDQIDDQNLTENLEASNWRIEQLKAQAQEKEQEALRLRIEEWDIEGSIAAYKEVIVIYNKILDEINIHNNLDPNENDNIDYTPFTQKKAEITQLILQLENVKLTGIDVERTVDDMREEYTIKLIREQIAQKREEIVNEAWLNIWLSSEKIAALYKATSQPDDKDEKKVYALILWFRSLENAVSEATSVEQAFNIWENGISGMIWKEDENWNDENEWKIAESFTSNGEPIYGDEKLKWKFRWIGFLNDRDKRSQVRKDFNNIVAQDIPKMEELLSEDKLESIWITEDPEYTWMEVARLEALDTWKEATDTLNQREAVLNTMRTKLVELGIELTQKKTALDTLTNSRDALSDQVTQLESQNRNSNQETAYQQAKVDLENTDRSIRTPKERIIELEWVDGISWLIKKQSESIQEYENREWEGSYKLAKTEEEAAATAYLDASKDYNEATLEKVAQWQVLNFTRTQEELSENAHLRKDLQEELKKNKTEIEKKSKLIQDAIKSWDFTNFDTLLEERRTLIDRREEVQWQIAQLDFNDRIAYTREYETVDRSLALEDEQLVLELKVIDEQMEAKKDRLSHILISYSLVRDAEAAGWSNNIDAVFWDTQSSQEKLSENAQVLVEAMYWWYNIQSEEMTVTYEISEWGVTKSVSDTWTIASVNAWDMMQWSIVNQEGDAIAIWNVDPENESNDEGASLPARQNFIENQRTEIDEIQLLMWDWQEYVDKETHVHVLQQRINAVDENIKIWNESLPPLQTSLDAIDKSVEQRFPEDDRILKKDFEWFLSAYNTLHNKYFDGNNYSRWYNSAETNLKREIAALEAQGTPNISISIWGDPSLIDQTTYQALSPETQNFLNDMYLHWIYADFRSEKIGEYNSLTSLQTRYNQNIENTKDQKTNLEKQMNTNPNYAKQLADARKNKNDRLDLMLEADDTHFDYFNEYKIDMSEGAEANPTSFDDIVLSDIDPEGRENVAAEVPAAAGSTSGDAESLPESTSGDPDWLNEQVNDLWTTFTVVPPSGMTNGEIFNEAIFASEKSIVMPNYTVVGTSQNLITLIQWAEWVYLDEDTPLEIENTDGTSKLTITRTWSNITVFRTQ